MAPQPSILIDTNIIIEATRIGAFSRLRARGQLVTVTRCCEEALSGKPGERGRIIVAPDELCDPLSVVEVSQAGRVHLALRYLDASILDAGERDLLVHAFTLTQGTDGAASMGAAFKKAGLPVKDRGGAFTIVSADQAAVRVAMLMGLGDQLVSLDEAFENAGIRATGLKRHYTRAALAEWKVRHRLGT